MDVTITGSQNPTQPPNAHSPTPSPGVNNASGATSMQTAGTLLQNLNQDMMTAADGTSSSSYPNNANEPPALPTPGNVPSDAPVQSSEPTDYELASQYDAAVMAGIKQGAADPADQETLIKEFLNQGKDAATQDPVLVAITTQAQQQVNEQYGRDVDEPIPEDQDSENNMASSVKQDQVEQLMQSYPDLYANGSLTDKGYQTLAAIMTGNTQGNPEAQALDQAANTALGFTPAVDADAFNAQVGVEFEQDFQQQIAGLSPQEQNTMQYYFNMDPTNPQVAGYIAAATAEIQQKYGPNITIVTENVSYNLKINGEYQMSLDQNIKQLGPKLSQTDIDTVKNYLVAKQNGQSFQISASLKAIGDQAYAAAIADVQTTYGVPAGWTPDTSITLSTFTSSPQGQMYLALSDQVSAMKTRLNSLPPSPEKATYLNLMQLITDALSKLQSMILTSSSLQAGGESAISRAQASLLQDKSTLMQAQQTAQQQEESQQTQLDAKQQQQAQKSAIICLMIAAAALMTVIGAIVSVLTLGLTAPVIIGIVLTVVILLITYIPSGQTDSQGNSESCMSVMMNGINSGIDQAAEAISGGNPQVMAAIGCIMRVVIIVALVAVACLAPSGWAAITPLIVTFITQSGFIQTMTDQICKATGAAEPPGWVSTLIEGILTVLVIIAAMKGGSGSDSESSDDEEGALGTVGAVGEDGSAAADAVADDTAVVNPDEGDEAVTDDADADAVNNPPPAEEAEITTEAENSTAETEQQTQRLSSRMTKEYVVNVIQKTVQLVNTGLQVAANVQQAETSFGEAQIEKLIAKTISDVASTDTKSQQIEAIIKMMQTAISHINQNMGDLSDWSKSINQQVRHQAMARSQMITNLTQAS